MTLIIAEGDLGSLRIELIRTHTLEGVHIARALNVEFAPLFDLKGIVVGDSKWREKQDSEAEKCRRDHGESYG